MEQSRNIRKEFLLKIAPILRWIFIVIVFIEFSLRVAWNDAILRIYINHIYCLPVNGIVLCGNDLIELGLINHRNR